MNLSIQKVQTKFIKKNPFGGPGWVAQYPKSADAVTMLDQVSCSALAQPSEVRFGQVHEPPIQF